MVLAKPELSIYLRNIYELSIKLVHDLMIVLNFLYEQHIQLYHVN